VVFSDQQGDKMPIVYHIVTILGAAFLTWLLILGVGGFILKKLTHRFTSLAFLFSLIYVVSAIILLPALFNISNIVLRDVQTRIAEPYIKAALNNAASSFSFSEGDIFYEASQLKWRSSDTKLLCVYRANWDCKTSQP
jgi:hypothetical protein